MSTSAGVTPKDIPSMAPLPPWFEGYPRLRGVYGLAPADALALSGICTIETYGRGELVFRAGEPSEAMYIVRSGHVAYRLSADAKGGTIGVVAGPGMPFGQRALTTGAPRLGTAYAVDDAEVVRMGRTEFELLRRERPGVERFLVEVMSTLVRYMTVRADDLVESGAERRVLRRLLELAYSFGPEPPVMVPLPQDDLAALSGVTRSTVNRVLRSAAEQGWVGLGWRRLVVLAPDAIHEALLTLPASRESDGDDVEGHAVVHAGRRPARRRGAAAQATPGGSSPTPA